MSIVRVVREALMREESIEEEDGEEAPLWRPLLKLNREEMLAHSRWVLAHSLRVHKALRDGLFNLLQMVSFGMQGMQGGGGGWRGQWAIFSILHLLISVITFYH